MFFANYDKEKLKIKQSVESTTKNSTTGSAGKMKDDSTKSLGKIIDSSDIRVDIRVDKNAQVTSNISKETAASTVGKELTDADDDSASKRAASGNVSSAEESVSKDGPLLQIHEDFKSSGTKLNIDTTTAEKVKENTASVNDAKSLITPSTAAHTNFHGKSLGECDTQLLKLYSIHSIIIQKRYRQRRQLFEDMVKDCVFKYGEAWKEQNCKKICNLFTVDGEYKEKPGRCMSGHSDISISY